MKSSKKKAQFKTTFSSKTSAQIKEALQRIASDLAKKPDDYEDSIFNFIFKYGDLKEITIIFDELSSPFIKRFAKEIGSSLINNLGYWKLLSEENLNNAEYQGNFIALILKRTGFSVQGKESTKDELYFRNQKGEKEGFLFKIENLRLELKNRDDANVCAKATTALLSQKTKDQEIKEHFLALIKSIDFLRN